MQQAPRRLIAFAVAAAIQIGAGAAVAAPTPEPEPVEARLEIDTSQAGAGGEVLHRRIDERANIVLRHAKVLPGDRYDATLEIAVREVEGDEPGYVVIFELRAADGSALDEPAEIACSLCTETELVARVETELEPVIAALRAHADSSDERDPIESLGEDPRPLEPVDPPTELTPAPRGHLGLLAGGVTLLALGAGSLATAVALIVPEPKVDQDDPLFLITTRPVGYTLLAGAAALAVTGAVLTAVAVRKRRQAQWSVAPYGAPGHVGGVVSWSFR
ncbi:hypothetical protein [Enhygromyxa salina]|uniref:hypothetical protein n=1 Tax=Enhygromyxa salina TaxID=215803 RepID=UPI000D090EBE|nr:hypothetical protein [Enhygromyxa salina]